MNCWRYNNNDDDDMVEEQNRRRHLQDHEPLAFSSDPTLIAATSRWVLPTSDDESLNIEFFDPNPTARLDCPKKSVLLWIHGICESAETWAVQNIVRHAAMVDEQSDGGVCVAVLELPGHGLSSGETKSLCPDFFTLVRHTVEFVDLVLKELQKSETTNITISYAIGGNSLGGTLAVYAAEIISRRLQDQDDEIFVSLPSSISIGKDHTFLGVIPVTPAIGVKSEALPPCYIVSLLSLASRLVPSANPPLTPLEDPSHYNCPSNTARNYAGHWPLATSKMLLDLTAYQVPSDVNSKTKLTLRNAGKVLLLVGGKDHVIPMESVHAFYDQVQSKQKDILVLKKAGHDLLVDQRSTQAALEFLFSIFASSNAEMPSNQ